MDALDKLFTEQTTFEINDDLDDNQKIVRLVQKVEWLKALYLEKENEMNNAIKLCETLKQELLKGAK